MNRNIACIKKKITLRELKEFEKIRIIESVIFIFEEMREDLFWFQGKIAELSTHDKGLQIS